MLFVGRAVPKIDFETISKPEKVPGVRCAKVSKALSPLACEEME
jgi:hypothetical protein